MNIILGGLSVNVPHCPPMCWIRPSLIMRILRIKQRKEMIGTWIWWSSPYRFQFKLARVGFVACNQSKSNWCSSFECKTGAFLAPTFVGNEKIVTFIFNMKKKVTIKLCKINRTVKINCGRRADGDERSVKWSFSGSGNLKGWKWAWKGDDGWRISKVRFYIWLCNGCEVGWVVTGKLWNMVPIFTFE